MTDTTSIPTAEEAAAMRMSLARFDQNEAYRFAMERHALYLALKPLVESDEFIAVHQAIAAIQENGPKDDMFFGIGLSAVYSGMTNLGIQCANWQEPVDPNAPVVTPTPAAEGTDNG
jgi:hypothetical protein